MNATIDSVLASAIAGVLLCSAVTKAAVPAPASTALGLLLGLHRMTPQIIRAAAIVEAAASVMLSVPAWRYVGAALSTALGFAFASIGVLGVVRHQDVPCGCFGDMPGHPFGYRNVLAGAALVTGSALMWWLTVDRTTDGLNESFLMTSGFALIVVCAVYRNLFIALLRVGAIAKRTV